MKILHVIHGYVDECTGGAESYVRSLLAEQRRQGLEVVLLAGSMHPWESCGTEETEVEGTRVVRLHRDDYYFDIHSKAYHPGVERLVREVLAAERPDLVHVHQWIRLTSNLVEICDDLGIPVVVTLHDYYTSCPRAFRMDVRKQPCRRPLSVESCLDCVPRYGHEPPEELAEGIRLHHEQYRSELGRARAVVVPTAGTGELLCSTTGFPAGRFTVLPMGYARRFEPAPERTPLPADGEPFRFGHWGHLAHHKGTHVLLTAFGRLLDGGPARAVELHLFGEPVTDELGRELDELARGRPVVSHGAYDFGQLAAARLHMAVFPMLCFETFGFVFDEAVELGLPAVVADLGAIAERAGAAALVVPPGDPKALAAAMDRVLERPALRDELAARLPPLPPLPGEHAARLLEIYERARRAPRLAEVPAVDPLRRAAFLVRQRESAQGHLHPGRGPR